MAVKLRTIVFLLTAVFWLTSCSVNNRDNDVEQIFSLDGKVELLFFFKKDIPQETRDSFFETTLNQPHPGGGYWPRDGIKSTFRIDRNGYEGYGFRFLDNATEEQRNEIKQLLEKTALLYRIYENVVPNEINDL